MLKSKRGLAILLALILAFSDILPANAEELFTAENESTEIFEEDFEEEYTHVSENETDTEQERRLEISLNQAEYFIQLGGLKDAGVEEYIALPGASEGQENIYFSDEEYNEKLDRVTQVIYEAVANKEKYVDISEFNLYCDDSEKAEEFLIGLVSGAVSYEPSFYYFKGITSYTLDEDDEFSGIELDYDYNSSGDTYTKALKAAYEEAVTDASAPDYVKAMQLHDWIVQHVTYSGSSSNCYSAYGAIVERKAVCMGYSLAYGDLLTMAGIKCGYVSSNSMNHMWNVVKLDGNWYYVDTTWDDPLGYTLGEMRYWYFLKSETVFRQYPTYHTRHSGSDWVICASNTYSYGSSSNVKCDSTSYDDGWWRYATSSVIYAGGSFYYVYHDPTGYYYSNYFVKRTGDSQEKIFDMTSDKWSASPYGSGPCKYYDIYTNDSYSCSHTCTSYVGGYIIFNTPQKIYRYKPGENTRTELYEVESSDDFVWTCLGCDNSLYIKAGTDNSSASVTSTYLYGIGNLKITASDSSVDWGSGKNIAFTGSFDKLSAGTPEINWYIKKNGEEETSITGQNDTIDVEKKIYNSKITVDTSSLDAGTYSVRMSVKLNDDILDKSYDFTVKQATFNLTGINLPANKNYDGKALATPTYSDCVTNAENLEFAWYKGQELKDSQLLSEAPSAVGSYWLKVSCIGNGNIKSGYKKYNIKINKTTLTLTAKPQTICYGDEIDKSSDAYLVSGLAENQTIDSINIKQSTATLTTSGNITLSNAVIKDERGEVVTGNYTVSYKSGKLVITKIAITVSAKEQTIPANRDISRKTSDVEISGLDGSKYLLTSVNLTRGRDSEGNNTITPSAAVIYQTNGNTDVSKFFDVNYIPGNLIIDKRTLSTVNYEDFYAWDDQDTHVYNMEGFVNLPSDAGKGVFSSSFVDPDGILELAEMDEGNPKTLNVKLNSLDESKLGKAATIYVDFESENYKGRVLEIKLTVSKTVRISFHANGGSIGDSSEITEDVFVGENLSKRYEPTAPVYKKFVGWYSDLEAGVPVTYASEAADVYARWETKYKVMNPVSSETDSEELLPNSKISLSCETPGAKIYYTTDGSVPQVNESNLYRDTIVLGEDTVIKAIAVKDNYSDSDLITFTYRIKDISHDFGDITADDMSEYPGSDSLWIAGLKEEYTYTGTAIIPEIRVYYGKTLLENKKDYKLSNGANKNIGKGTIKITGCNNYSGVISKEFEIVPYDLSDYSEIEKEVAYAVYTGKPIAPAVTVKRNGKALKLGSDYKVSYSSDGTNYQDKVTGGAYELYTVKITGLGGYTGETYCYALVTTANLMSKATVSGVKNVNYSGSPYLPNLTVKMSGKTLVLSPEDQINEETDCFYKIMNNTDAGTVTVTIIGMGYNHKTARGSFVGNKTVTFKINPLDIGKVQVSGIPSTVEYAGEPITFDSANLTLMLGTTELVYGRDYEISGYKANAQAGTASVSFKGIGNYKGTVTKKFKITPFNILTGQSHVINVDYPDVVEYSKGGVTPEVTVRLDDKILTAGKDYKVSYANNNAVGNQKKLPTITISGKGGFTGNIKVYFTIVQKDISKVTLTASDIKYSNKGGNCKTSISVKDTNGKNLAGSDYTNISYSYGADTVVYVGETAVSVHEGDPIGKYEVLPVGTILRVTVSGKGNYYGTVSKEYMVTEADIKNAKVTIPDQVYTGKEITLKKSDIEVKISGKTIDLADFEIVGYESNIKKGTATVILRGRGNYAGNIKAKFRIKARDLVNR